MACHVVVGGVVDILGVAGSRSNRAAFSDALGRQKLSPISTLQIHLTY